MARVSTSYGNFHRKLPCRPWTEASPWPSECHSDDVAHDEDVSLRLATDYLIQVPTSVTPAPSSPVPKTPSQATGANGTPEDCCLLEVLQMHEFVGSAPIPSRRHAANGRSLSPVAESFVEDFSVTPTERSDEVRVRQFKSEAARIRGGEHKLEEISERGQIMRQIEALRVENEKLKSSDLNVSAEIIQQSHDLTRTHESAIRETNLQIEVLSAQLDQSARQLESYQMHETCVDEEIEQLRAQEESAEECLIMLKQELQENAEATKLPLEKPLSVPDDGKIVLEAEGGTATAEAATALAEELVSWQAKVAGVTEENEDGLLYSSASYVKEKARSTARHGSVERLRPIEAAVPSVTTTTFPQGSSISRAVQVSRICTPQTPCRSLGITLIPTVSRQGEGRQCHRQFA